MIKHAYKITYWAYWLSEQKLPNLYFSLIVQDISMSTKHIVADGQQGCTNDVPIRTLEASTCL